MKYAIGAPGAATARLVIDTEDVGRAHAQCEAGEIVSEMTTDRPPEAIGVQIDANGNVAFVMPPPPSIAEVEAQLIAQIDANREARQMDLLTAGGAKTWVYSRKAAEVDRSTGTSAAKLDALSATDRQARYPFASAEAALTGEKLSSVLARFAAGVASSGEAEALEARAQVAKRAVRAATTIAAKRAAANVNWSV